MKIYRLPFFCIKIFANALWISLFSLKNCLRGILTYQIYLHFSAPSVPSKKIEFPQIDVIIDKTKNEASLLFKLSAQFCKIIVCLLYFYKYMLCYNCLYCSRWRRQVTIVYLLGTIIFVFIVVSIILTLKKNIRRRKDLEQILERYRQSREALVRYVMLNRRCSEDAAYERLALFVKKHIPLDDHCSIDNMLANDRQKLIDNVHNILAHDPSEIDKI